MKTLNTKVLTQCFKKLILVATSATCITLSFTGYSHANLDDNDLESNTAKIMDTAELPFETLDQNYERTGDYLESQDAELILSDPLTDEDTAIRTAHNPSQRIQTDIMLVAGAAFISSAAYCENDNNLECVRTPTLWAGDIETTDLPKGAGILVATTKINFVVHRKQCDYFKVVNLDEDARIKMSGVSWDPSHKIEGSSVVFVGSEDPGLNMDCELPTPQKLAQIEKIQK